MGPHDVHESIPRVTVERRDQCKALCIKVYILFVPCCVVSCQYLPLKRPFDLKENCRRMSCIDKNDRVPISHTTTMYRSLQPSLNHRHRRIYIPISVRQHLPTQCSEGRTYGSLLVSYNMSYRFTQPHQLQHHPHHRSVILPSSPNHILYKHFTEPPLLLTTTSHVVHLPLHPHPASSIHM